MKEKEFDPKAFDFLFVGEAEHSFPQFLEQYERGGDLSEVGGIIYKPNGEIISTGQPDPIVDIKDDRFPRKRWFPKDGLPFLELLPVTFSGSYFKASLIEEVDLKQCLQSSTRILASPVSKPARFSTS